MNQLELIQQQGFNFLQSKDLFSALKMSEKSGLNCYVSILLKTNCYYLVTTAKAERIEFEAYVNEDFLSAEILIPPTSNESAIAQIKFQIEHLIGTAMKNQAVKTIIDEKDLSIWHLVLNEKPSFVTWTANEDSTNLTAPIFTPAEEVKTILLNEVNLNRGYAVDSIQGLTKYFNYVNEYVSYVLLLTLTTDDLVYRLFQSHHTGNFYHITYEPSGKKYIKTLASELGALSWLDRVTMLEGVDYDVFKYSQLVKKLAERYKQNIQLFGTDESDRN
jgi:hypothetical protein